jgi:hypothetical protein
MGTKVRRTIIATLVLVTAVGTASGQVGTVTYLEGSVTVVRDGRRIWEEVDFGFPLEGFDLVETADDGLAELDLEQPGGVHARVMVQPSTSFYVDMEATRTESPSGLELLGGSVELAVRRYGAGFEVRTQTATMGVRGTVFAVSSSIQGDILVTCTEGSVVCSTGQGPALLATPGRAVEARIDDVLRNLTVGGANTDEFRRDWTLDRFDAFQANPMPLFDYYSERYIELREQFHDAYRVLVDRRDVLDKWMREDERGTMGSPMERMRERRAVLPGLMDVRRVLFFLERVYFRAVALTEAAQSRLGDAVLSSGMTVSEFAAMVRDDATILEPRMHEVRYIFKLFADRNDGRLPFDGIENDLETPEDPFGEPFSNPLPFGNSDDSGM